MTEPNRLPASEWVAALDRSDAQLAAGETVPLAPFMKRLRESIEQLEAKQQVTPRRSAAPRR